MARDRHWGIDQIAVGKAGKIAAQAIAVQQYLWIVTSPIPRSQATSTVDLPLEFTYSVLVF